MGPTNLVQITVPEEATTEIRDALKVLERRLGLFGISMDTFFTPLNIPVYWTSLHKTFGYCAPRSTPTDRDEIDAFIAEFLNNHGVKHNRTLRWAAKEN
jgi:hypothetical protein